MPIASTIVAIIGMPYTVGKLLNSAFQWNYFTLTAVCHIATISLYFPVAKISCFTVFGPFTGNNKLIFTGPCTKCNTLTCLINKNPNTTADKLSNHHFCSASWHHIHEFSLCEKSDEPFYKHWSKLRTVYKTWDSYSKIFFHYM